MMAAWFSFFKQGQGYYIFEEVSDQRYYICEEVNGSLSWGYKSFFYVKDEYNVHNLHKL